MRTMPAAGELAWESLQHWTRILSELHQAFDITDDYSQAFTAEFILQRRSPVRHVVQRLIPFLAEHGLSWDSLDKVLAVRSELFEIDTRFGQLGGSGIFEGLDSAGMLTHHVAGVEAIEDAMTHPPAIGRARIRGEVIKRLAGQKGHYRCDWQVIADLRANRVLDLSEPFETEERWLDLGQARSSLSSVFYDLLARLGDPAQPDGWPGRLEP